MTDEEIRALLDGHAPPLSQESATTRLQAAAPELAREVLRLRAELTKVTTRPRTAQLVAWLVEEVGKARAESRERLCEVERLTPLLADAERRIARLERILAVERGDASAAPEGWAWSSTSWRRGPFVAWRVLSGRWGWIMSRENGQECSALEAMEAADRAAKESP